MPPDPAEEERLGPPRPIVVAAVAVVVLVVAVIGAALLNSRSTNTGDSGGGPITFIFPSTPAQPGATPGGSAAAGLTLTGAVSGTLTLPSGQKLSCPQVGRPAATTNMFLAKAGVLVTIDPSGGSVTLQLPLQDIFRGTSIYTVNAGQARFSGTLLDPNGSSLDIAGQLPCN